MNGHLVVKRYARALLECYEESGRTKNLINDMNLIEKICADVPEIKSFCLKPHSNIKDEIEFINAVFIPYIEELTGRLLMIALTNSRLSAIPFLPAAINELLEKKGGDVTVLLEMANNHDEGILSLAKVQIAKRIGKNLNLKINILPELLGGFRIIWQNRIIDMSIAGRLKNLHRRLKQDNL